LLVCFVIAGLCESTSPVRMWFLFAVRMSRLLLFSALNYLFSALNYLFSALCYLKTAFLLANHNREIFSCLLLLMKLFRMFLFLSCTSILCVYSLSCISPFLFYLLPSWVIHLFYMAAPELWKDPPAFIKKNIFCRVLKKSLLLQGVFPSDFSYLCSSSLYRVLTANKSFRTRTCINIVFRILH